MRLKTLMMIMVTTVGLIFAISGVLPEAYAANPNMIVSAENSMFDNHMSGPQVIEVVIIDADINDITEGEGEPDVFVNNNDLRMVQAADGNWYGYFADLRQAQIADSTTNIAGSGLDFGEFCDNTSNIGDDITIDISGTVGIAVGTTTTGGINGTGTLAQCTSFGNGTDTRDYQNVLREEKGINMFASSADAGDDAAGQIGIHKDIWPFIQLYNFIKTDNVIIQYNKGGNIQSTTLTFDTVVQFAGLELDRTTYPINAQVHATITDIWLNIDPTDEDSWTFATNDTAGADTFYQVFDEDGEYGGDAISLSSELRNLMCDDNCMLVIDTNVQNHTNPVLTLQSNNDTSLVLSGDTNDAAAFSVATQSLLGEGTVPVTITEQGPNTGIFGTYDESDISVMIITGNAARATSASIGYNETMKTIPVGYNSATIDIAPDDDEWNSGEEVPITIIDGDANLNGREDEDLDVYNPDVTIIPALSTGDPFTLAEAGNTDEQGNMIVQFARYAVDIATSATVGTNASAIAGPITTDMLYNGTARIDDISDRAILGDTSTPDPSTNSTAAVLIDFETTLGDLLDTVKNATRGSELTVLNFFNYDVRSFEPGDGEVDIFLIISNQEILNITGHRSTNHNTIQLVDGGDAQGYVSMQDSDLRAALFGGDESDNIGLVIQFDDPAQYTAKDEPIVADFFSFGFTGDGVQSSERIANQIIRIEAEETGDNTNTFTGSLEYLMVNQLNIINPDTYSGITLISDDPSFIVIEDLTDEDSPRVSYADLGIDNVVTTISDQEETPTHSGVISLDQDSYKVSDTIEITLEDLDLNIDSDLIDIFTIVTTDSNGGTDNDQVGSDVPADLEDLSFGSLGRLLDVTFGDVKWQDTGAGCDATYDDGLAATGFMLAETGIASGIFTGDFQIPLEWCPTDDGQPQSTIGLDIAVNYVDYRDASGEIVKVGHTAGIRANTGSVSLDRIVYPVPFGVPDDFADSTRNHTDGRSVFPVHTTGFDGIDGLQDGEFLTNGDLIIHIRVNDTDFDVNPNGEDSINRNSTDNVGPVKISVLRDSAEVILGYAGGPAILDGPIILGGELNTNSRQFGPMVEIAGDAGIFEYDLVLRYTDGPASNACPVTETYTNIRGNDATNQTARFNVPNTSEDNFCILQGDILQVEYTDPADASGSPGTVTDSAAFDLRDGVLQSDKTIYIIGSDMILTLIEPDFDLDNDSAERYDLDLIQWDSAAATVSMGGNNGDDIASAFDPEPADFRETGDSTGVFQIVIEIPEALNGQSLQRGEQIRLEYRDWAPSGSDYVGEDDERVNLTAFTSNFGATVELDQRVYTWTDKVYITIVAPDHNFDSDSVDQIGDSGIDAINISTRNATINDYTLAESGTDTGIFTGEVILTGFAHDADGDSSTGDDNGFDVLDRPAFGTGPTDGLLPTSNNDGITVSFDFSEDQTVVGSALVRWNIGEVQWLEANYPSSGTGVVRVIDPDMNLDPERVDNFDVDVYSDADAGGIDLTVTETNEATGIFEGTVFFTVTDQSSGHRLRVAEGDTITARYEDHTLPAPLTIADELNITATSTVGTVTIFLEPTCGTGTILVDGVCQVVVNSEPAPTPTSNRSGGGGGGGGGGGSGGTNTGSTISSSLSQIGKIKIHSASWDCKNNIAKVIVSPDSELLDLSIRTTVGIVTAELSDEQHMSGHKVFTTDFGAEESYLGIQLSASTGRNAAIVNESINIKECTGSKTFAEYETSFTEYETSSSNSSQSLPADVSPAQKSLHNVVLYDSPSIQMKQGMPLNDVMCNDGRELYIRDGTRPICIKPSTFDILVYRDLNIVSNGLDVVTSKSS